MTVYRVVRASDTVIADTDGQVSTYDGADDRWEPREPTSGTSGSGARLVSGTVTFTTEDRSLAPFVVATTGGATVEGVALSAGQMAAFWYLSGEWHVMVHGQDTTWRSTAAPDTRIAVTPTGPTFTNAPSGGGGTWTTPTQTGITYSPASGTATAGQSVTVTATISDPANYKFTSGAQTSWTHTFPDPNAPITDTFTGTAGPLAGHATTTGGLVWAAADGAGWNLTGDGGIRPSGTSGMLSNTLPTLTNVADVSIDYSERAERFAIGFGTHTHGLQVALAVNGEVLCFVSNTNIVSPQKWETASSGTLRFRYDGSTVTFWVNGVQVATQTGVTISPLPLRVTTGANGGGTKLSNLTIAPVSPA